MSYSKMNYRMKVTITDPNTPKGMMSELFFDLACNFSYNPDTYGNGYYVSIQSKDFYKQLIDLRYDKTFDRNNKEKWLKEWANNYWTGENGTWSIKHLEIVPEENTED